VTTKKFLEVFGLASLRDLPDIERLEDAGLLQCSAHEIELDAMLGVSEEDEIEDLKDVDDALD
jgi:hypothetical protein